MGSCPKEERLPCAAASARAAACKYAGSTRLGIAAGSHGAVGADTLTGGSWALLCLWAASKSARAACFWLISRFWTSAGPLSGLYRSVTFAWPCTTGIFVSAKFQLSAEQCAVPQGSASICKHIAVCRPCSMLARHKTSFGLSTPASAMCKEQLMACRNKLQQVCRQGYISPKGKYAGRTQHMK